MRLETVEQLTRDRDLVSRHVIFLSAERDKLKAKEAKGELSTDDRLRLNEIESRLPDCKAYLAQIEPQLELSILELAEKIRQLPDEKFSLILFERYVLLKPLKAIAQELGLNITSAYALHTKARNLYNEQENIPYYQDPRGRKKGLRTLIKFYE